MFDAAWAHEVLRTRILESWESFMPSRVSACMTLKVTVRNQCGHRLDSSLGIQQVSRMQAPSACLVWLCAIQRSHTNVTMRGEKKEHAGKVQHNATGCRAGKGHARNGWIQQKRGPCNREHEAGGCGSSCPSGGPASFAKMSW